MDLKEHQRNVGIVFDYWDETAPTMHKDLRHACEVRFNERIEKYGFLDLDDLDDLRQAPNGLLERSYRNFNEGNFLDAINLTVLHHWISQRNLEAESGA